MTKTPKPTFTRPLPSLSLYAEEEVLAYSLSILETKLRGAGEIMSSPTLIKTYLRTLLQETPYEVFGVILLDAQNRLMHCEEMFRGTLSQTAVYPREVVTLALKRNAAGIVFFHNHPSGLAEPSHADQLLTSALKQALALVDVKVLDHFIVGGYNVLSFAERGLL